MTVGHSPSLGRSIFLAAQQRRDMFANKADTVFSPAPPWHPGKGRREGGDKAVCPKLCLAGTLEGSGRVCVCPAPAPSCIFNGY